MAVGIQAFGVAALGLVSLPTLHARRVVSLSHYAPFWFYYLS